MKINEIVWDSENKEYVLITNGIPVVEGKPEIKPTEAIALRVAFVGPDGKPRIAFTYRQVKAQFLSELAALKLLNG